MPKFLRSWTTAENLTAWSHEPLVDDSLRRTPCASRWLIGAICCGYVAGDLLGASIVVVLVADCPNDGIMTNGGWSCQLTRLTHCQSSPSRCPDGNHRKWTTENGSKRRHIWKSIWQPKFHQGMLWKHSSPIELLAKSSERSLILTLCFF